MKCENCKWRKVGVYGVSTEWCDALAEFLDYIYDDIKKECTYFVDRNLEKVGDKDA